MTTKCHPGVLEDKFVFVNTENDANLLTNVFKTYTESFIQLWQKKNFSRLHLSSKCHPGVLEDRLVTESPEVDANLFVNVFRTYAESFIQF